MFTRIDLNLGNCQLFLKGFGTWTGKQATKWLLEVRLKWNEQDIKEKLTGDVFNKNHLSGMLTNVFNGSVYKAINEVYPERFKPLELPMTPIHYWNKEKGVEAVRWLIEEKLKWSESEIKKELNQKIFIEYGLNGMLVQVFKGSPYEAVNSLYPNRFKHREMGSTSMKYWNCSTAIEAMEWLIEEKLKWSDSDIKEKLSVKIFRENGLKDMLTTVFHDSPFLALDALYPNRFKPWELSSAPLNYWTHEHGIAATKWLIEKKLRWGKGDIVENINASLFKENG